MCISTAYSSPNFNERKFFVSGIVIHYTEEELDDTLRIFLDEKRENRVSAHYVIARDGTVISCVPEDKRAWHAGVGKFAGIKDLNDASIGIELVHMPDEEYQNVQIDVLIELCKSIQERYDIKWVIGHSDSAFDRKIDPGVNFPWRRLFENGIGFWTDDFAVPRESDKVMLKAIGYDVSNLDKAREAFQRHYFPEALLAKDTRTRERLAAIYDCLPKICPIMFRPTDIMRQWFIDKYKNVKEEKSNAECLRIRREVLEVCYTGRGVQEDRGAKAVRAAKDFNSFIDVNDKRLFFIELYKRLFWKLGINWNEFISLKDRCAANEELKNNSVLLGDRSLQANFDCFFDAASDRLCTLAQDNNELAREQIEALMGLLDVLIFRRIRIYFSDHQIHRVVETAVEYLHQLRDNVIGDNPAWHRWWLWMCRFVAILRDPRRGGTCLLPWCELMRVKALRHKLFDKRREHAPEELIAEIKANIRASFKRAIDAGWKHLTSRSIGSSIKSYGKMIPSFEEAVFRDAEQYKEVALARMTLARIYESRAKYLCYSSDKKDLPELNECIKYASELCDVTNAWTGYNRLETNETIPPPYVSSSPFRDEFLPLVSSVLFRKACARDYWRRGDVRRKVLSDLYKSWKILDVLYMDHYDHNDCAGEIARRKFLGDFARKLCFYATYYFENKDFFDSQKVVGADSLVDKDGTIEPGVGVIKKAEMVFRQIGFVLPWETLDNQKVESPPKMYWDFEMLLWLELRMRVGSYKYDTDSRWRCVGFGNRDTTFMFAEIILIYTELSYQGDAVSKGRYSNCRKWARQRLGLRNREDVCRVTDMSVAECLKLTMDVLYFSPVSVDGGNEKGYHGNVGLTGFAQWVEYVLKHPKSDSDFKSLVREFITSIFEDYCFLVSEVNKIGKEKNVGGESFYLGKILRHKGEVPLPSDKVVLAFLTKWAKECKVKCWSRLIKSMPKIVDGVNPKRKQTTSYDLTGYGFLIDWIKEWRGDLSKNKLIAKALGMEKSEGIVADLKNNKKKWSEKLLRKVSELIGVEPYEIAREKQDIECGRIGLRDSMKCGSEQSVMTRLRSLGCDNVNEEQLLAQGLLLFYREQMVDRRLTWGDFVSLECVARLFNDYQLAQCGGEEMWNKTEVKNVVELRNRITRTEIACELDARAVDAVDSLKLSFECVKAIQRPQGKVRGKERMQLVRFAMATHDLLCKNNAKAKWDGTVVLGKLLNTI